MTWHTFVLGAGYLSLLCTALIGSAIMVAGLRGLYARFAARYGEEWAETVACGILLVVMFIVCSFIPPP